MLKGGRFNYFSLECFIFVTYVQHVTFTNKLTFLVLRIQSVRYCFKGIFLLKLTQAAISFCLFYPFLTGLSGVPE